MLPFDAGSERALDGVPGLGPLRVGTPPYASLQRRFEVPRSPPPGTVVVMELRLASMLDRPEPTVRAMRKLRVQALECAFLGQVPEAVRPVEVTLLSRVRAAGVRAFVRAGTAAALRRALAESGLMSRDVDIWLTARLESSVPGSRVPALAALLCGDDVDRERLPASRSALGADLPTLHKWVMVGKVLSPLVGLQTDPGMAVEAAARASPYSGASSFGRACRTLFGMPPSEIRQLLGWEWLLDRFLGPSARD